MDNPREQVNRLKAKVDSIQEEIVQNTSRRDSDVMVTEMVMYEEFLKVREKEL